MDLMVLDNIEKDKQVLKKAERPRFATVVDVNSQDYCKIKIDGDTEAYDVYYPSLYKASTGDRVYISWDGNTVVVQGSTDNHSIGSNTGVDKEYVDSKIVEVNASIEAINKKIQIPMPLNAGYSIRPEWGGVVVKNGLNEVSINIGVTGNVPTTETVVGILPTGWRPPHRVQTSIIGWGGAAGTTLGWFVVHPNGECRVGALAQANAFSTEMKYTI